MELYGSIPSLVKTFDVYGLSTNEITGQTMPCEGSCLKFTTSSWLILSYISSCTLMDCYDNQNIPNMNHPNHINKYLVSYKSIYITKKDKKRRKCVCVMVLVYVWVVLRMRMLSRESQSC